MLMTKELASHILSVELDANLTDIKNAYVKLVQNLRPNFEEHLKSGLLSAISSHKGEVESFISYTRAFQFLTVPDTFTLEPEMEPIFNCFTRSFELPAQIEQLFDRFSELAFHYDLMEIPAYSFKIDHHYSETCFFRSPNQIKHQTPIFAYFSQMKFPRHWLSEILEACFKDASTKSISFPNNYLLNEREKEEIEQIINRKPPFTYNGAITGFVFGFSMAALFFTQSYLLMFAVMMLGTLAGIQLDRTQFRREISPRKRSFSEEELVNKKVYELGIEAAKGWVPYAKSFLNPKGYFYAKEYDAGMSHGYWLLLKEERKIEEERKTKVGI